MERIIEPVVSTDWLEKNLDSSILRILDASWYLPTQKRNQFNEYRKRHIPGAQLFDIDIFSDECQELPHMAPSEDKFVGQLKRMGIGDEHHVIVYDGSGLFSAGRAWWLFKLFGKTHVSILDGGFPKWINENKPVSDVIPSFPERLLGTKPNLQMISGWRRVLIASKSGEEQIIDARSEDRFKGLVEEPRPGLRSGHIPRSVNICFSEILNPDKTVKSVSEISSIFLKKGIDIDKPIITTCGSGVTAAVLNLALELIGAKKVCLYDGSWCEWGGDNKFDVELG